MESSKRSPYSPTAPAASSNSEAPLPGLALLRAGGAPPNSSRASAAWERPHGTWLQPPSSRTRSVRGYEDQLHLAATTLLERSREDDAKHGLTSVLVMLALCVFVGLVVSAVLATSRGRSASKEPEGRQPGIREPSAVLLRQEAPAAAAYALPGHEGSDGAWNTRTSGGAGAGELGARATKLDGNDEQRRNASARVIGSWEDTLEQREWTMDLPPSVANESAVLFPMAAGDNAALSSDRLSTQTANKRGVTAPLGKNNTEIDDTRLLEPGFSDGLD